VTDPSVLFLDEPTSGLDSTTATALCSTLKSIAQSKKMTIAAVIHQPSLSSFLEFDDLLLLGKGGRVVYAGPVNDAPKYFNDLGFPLPANCNPADHYLDLCQGAVPRKGHPEFDWPHLFDLWEEHRLQKPISRQHSVAVQQAIAMAADKDSDAGGKLKAFVEAAKEALLHIFYGIEDYWVTFFKDLNAFFRDFGKPDPIRVTPGIRKQFRLCLERSLKQVFTTPREFILQLLVHLGIGILISQVNYLLKHGEFSGN
jgi:ABC-2 type transporter